MLGLGIGWVDTLSRFDKRKGTRTRKKQLKTLYKVKYGECFIWYDLWDKTGNGASLNHPSLLIHLTLP